MVLGVVIAAPLLLVPHQSKAGGLVDLINALLGADKDKKPKDPTPGTPTNSVPLDKGTVFLVVAGLGLGAKMIYDRRRNVEKSVI